MACILSCPSTLIAPDAGEAVYPVNESTVYETVPFGAENTIRVPVEDRVVPWIVTDHEVEADKPDCSNVRVYVTGVHPTIFATVLPCTSIDPDPEDAEKPGTDPIAYAYVPSGTEKVIALPVEV
jgi:hypothetical protein